MALTSDEMNFLIYRYLRESGFEHSAYAFGNESYVYKSSIDGSAVPPGALISFVQKGLQYVEIEAHINDDGTETLCDESFSVLRKHTCRVKQRKRIFDPYEPMESDYGPLELDDTQLTQLKGHLDMICCCAWHPTEPILATGSGDGTVRLWVIRPIDDSASDTTTSTTTASTTSSTTTSSSSSTTTTTSTSTTTTPTLRYEAIMETSTILKPAHLDKVTTVTAMEEDDGNKDGDDDGDEGDKKKRTKNSNKRQKTSVQAATSAVMASMAPVIKHNRSIVAMDWSPLGTHIATGCYDGSVRIWTRQGTLALTLKQHQAPISSVRYHPKGDLLLTASVDQSVIVWDAASGDVRHATRIHTAPVIDIDWRNDTSYATCGVDHMIHIINVGEDIPYRSLTQHTRDVNAIRFDPSGSMLASASDDGTVKIWKFDKDTTTSNGITEIPPGMGPSQAPLHDLKEHDREVSIVRWSPTGPGTKNPDTPLMLASASLDTTIKLWDPVEGRCLLTLAKHIHPVTSLAFSPNGQYIASGSHDRTHIWATKDGTLLKTYKTDVGGVNDLSWDSTGHELAVMFSHPTAVVLHIHV